MAEPDSSSTVATNLEFEDTRIVDVAGNPGTRLLWETCSDPEVLVTCIPGAESVERLSERRYRGTVTRGISSLTVSLSGEVELVERNEPDWLLASGQAYDERSHSEIEGLAAMELDRRADGCLVIDYRADVDLGGGIASMPTRILRRVIGRDIKKYFDNLEAAVRRRSSD